MISASNCYSSFSPPSVFVLIVVPFEVEMGSVRAATTYVVGLVSGATFKSVWSWAGDLVGSSPGNFAVIGGYLVTWGLELASRRIEACPLRVMVR